MTTRLTVSLSDDAGAYLEQLPDRQKSRFVDAAIHAQMRRERDLADLEELHRRAGTPSEADRAAVAGLGAAVDELRASRAASGRGSAA